MSAWRGRPAGLARLSRSRAVVAVLLVVAVAVVVIGAASAAISQPAIGGWQLVVKTAEGELLLRVPLAESRFTLRYRNSLYGSLAEERFAIDPNGRLMLVELAADEAAVLDEYYGIRGRPHAAQPPDARRWRARPAEPVLVVELPLAATQHGERTLVVADQEPVPLWQLVSQGERTVVLSAERGP